MQPDNRRYAWIAVVILMLVVVGALGFGLGIAAVGRGVLADMPMRGYMLRGGGFGLAGLFWPLLLVGLGVVLVAVLVRETGHRATPPPPVTSAPPAPSPTTDGIDRLRDLAAMHEKGQLTDEEFTAAKRQLLGL